MNQTVRALPKRNPRAPRRRPHAFLLLPVALFLLLAGSPRHLQAQAQSDMTRSAAIHVFGGYTLQSPDYGQFNNNGITAGVDFTRYLHSRFAAALELRGTYTSGQVVNEKDVLVGPKVSYNFRRYHPYADFEFGALRIDFHYPPDAGYLYDAGVAIAPGGGLEYDVAHNFAARADFSYKHVHIHDPDTDITLTAPALSLGVTYTIPFRPLIRNGR